MIASRPARRALANAHQDRQASLLGAAAGAGGPLVLVGQAASVPADLADSPVFETDQVDDVIGLIRELGPRRRKWLIQNVSGVSGPG
jgi:hypothetical protein